MDKDEAQSEAAKAIQELQDLLGTSLQSALATTMLGSCAVVGTCKELGIRLDDDGNMGDICYTSLHTAFHDFHEYVEGKPFVKREYEKCLMRIAGSSLLLIALINRSDSAEMPSHTVH